MTCLQMKKLYYCEKKYAKQGTEDNQESATHEASLDSEDNDEVLVNTIMM